jgi:lipid II isoglutaminyl synthase (glutamine-hydrolysing)
MKIRYFLSVIIGKLIIIFLKLFKRSATALPGKISLKICPYLLEVINDRCENKLIITGTNGKTTTNNLIHHILTSSYDFVLSNLKGANMPQGIASAFLKDIKKKYNWGIFEVDEGSFSEVLQHIHPDYIIITNFFRDQLDRYGEIESTVSIVYESIKPLDSTLILNADDPLVANFKSLKKNSVYYGVVENYFSNQHQNVIETRFCPSCNDNLNYEYFNYGQIGKFGCEGCGFDNPPYNYSIIRIKGNGKNCFDIKAKEEIFENVCFKYEGIYNAYNCCAALTFCLEIGMISDVVIERIENFEYHLGRMEIIEFDQKILKITLAKNPIGLTEVLKNISYDNKKKSILFILNDNPADGRDVSWIWDANFETLNVIKNLESIYCSGRRAEDMALRIKYTNFPTHLINVDDSPKDAIMSIINENVDSIYLLPTYTAVFQTRDIVFDYIKNSHHYLDLSKFIKNFFS